ncbi:MAG: TRAP transporter small permease [Rhodospirillaceae bacterium]|nr:TRAP transporter small permease [Rhodospirillaceae bacterium]
MTDRTDSSNEPGWRRFATFEAAVSALNSLGSLWIAVLMVVIIVDIVGRTAFSMPLRGVPELVKLSIVGIVFIQLGHTLRSGRMTRSDGLLRIFRTRLPRLSHAMTLLFNLVGAGLFVLILDASYPFFVKAWATGEYAGIQGYVSYPVWPVRLIILVGCAVAAIQYCLFAWRDVSVVFGWLEPAAPDDRRRLAEMLK